MPRWTLYDNRAYHIHGCLGKGRETLKPAALGVARTTLTRRVVDFWPVMSCPGKES